MLGIIGGILGKAFAAILSLVILALIGSGVMLSRGPVSLAPLAPYLEDFMDDPSWRFRVQFEDAVLRWEGWRKKLDLRVIGARFVERGGGELISVPSLSVAFDVQALLSGQVRVSGLELIGPKLRLLRHADGAIEITNESSGSGGVKGSGLRIEPGMLAGRAGEGGLDTFGDLRRLSVRGADLSFHDVASDLRLAMPSADLSLSQEPGGVSVRLSTRLRIGQSEAAFGLSALYRDESTAIVAAVNFAEVDIAGLANAIGGNRLDKLRGMAVVAAGRLDLSILPNGSVDSLGFDITTGPGRLGVPQLPGETLAIAGLAAKGRFVKNFTQLNVSDLHLDLGQGLTARAGGDWSMNTGGIALRAKGNFVNLPVGELSHYWPEDLGTGARRWVLKNVHDGLITEGRFAIDLRPGDLLLPTPRPGMARLDWTFRDVSADYFGELPSIVAAAGSGYIDGLEFGLTVSGATAGGLQLSEGKLHVADLTVEPPVLDVAFVAHGPVSNALAVLEAKPLGFAKELSITARDTRGTSATRALLRIPLDEDVTLARIGYSAAANLAELSLSGIAGGYAVEGGEYTVSVEGGALQISGRGRINGVPLELTWKRNLQAGDASSGTNPSDHLTIRGTANGEQWKALRLTPLPVLRGAVDMAVSIDFYPGGTRRGAGRFDLTAAELHWPDIGWNKPATVPAAMNLTFQEEVAGELVLDRFEFSGGGLQFSGRAAFDKDQNLVSLNSDNFIFGATQLAVRAAPRAGGGYRVDLMGPSLDLRAFAPHLLDQGTSAEEPPLDLKMQIDRVYLTEEVVLHKLVGTGLRAGGEWQAANMRAGLAGGQTVGFTVQGEGSGAGRGRRFTVAAGDAGGMARALGIYSDARGGTMFLNFLVPGGNAPGDPLDDTITGTLRADNFSVVKAQVLTRLLTLGSLTGLSDVLNDKGISFTRLDVPFTMRAGVLHIERARAVGPALAVIATGDYIRETQALRFQGTVVPSYTLNSVLGVIPILGELLIGRKGEGVFAFTYKVDGTLEKPKVSVNLLSALAPGILRRIVDGLDKPVVAADPPKPNSGDQ